MKSLPKELVQKFDALSALRHLECDGMTRVVSHLLAKAGVAHEVCTGYVSLVNVPRWVKDRTITHHWWAEFSNESGTFVIDYRARMWLGDHRFVAHGIFKPEKFPSMAYRERQRGTLNVPDFLFDVLTSPMGVRSC